MLEYLDLELFKALLFLFVVIVTGYAFELKEVNQKDYKGKVFFMALVFMFIWFLNALYTKNSIEKNIADFVNGQVFICKGGDENNYKVGKVKGWRVENTYFIKDSLLIRADRCEER